MNSEPTNSPATMQALFIEEVGGAFIRRDLAMPQPAAGEVLVKIAASGVNPLDTKIRAGKAAHAQHPFPAVLGLDLAGTVVGVGPGVANFKLGDEVFGMTGGVGGVQGSLATHASVDASLLAHKPASLSMREAAALPLIFITAWEGLVDRARIKSGKKALIHGGLGGVGHVAVQIAKAFGADVYATVSSHHMDGVAELGATPIDYRAQTVEQYVTQHTGGEGFDIVYDTVGGETLAASFEAARTYHGHVVSCLGRGQYELGPLSFRAATYSGVFTLIPLLTGKGRAHHGEILAQAARMAESGLLSVRLDAQTFALDKVAEAHALVASGKAQGKVVVDVL